MDDILGEESDNESESQGKDKMDAKVTDDVEEERRQPGGGQTPVRKPGPSEESLQTSSSDTSLSQNVQRWEPSPFVPLRWTFLCFYHSSTNTSSGVNLSNWLQTSSI